MSRFRCGLAAAGALLPAVCHGHGFGERYDLPAPLPYFVAGAALAVALSFVAVAWASRGHVSADAARRYESGLGTLPAWLTRPLQALSVALLLLVIVAGAVGNPFPGENFAPTWVWVVWWVGLSLFAACIGNPWPTIDPWRALFDAADALARRLGRPGVSLHRTYPRALGLWPAVFLLLLVGWIEVVFPDASIPARIAGLAGAWTLVTLAGMVWFGRDAWQRNADVFAIYFGLLGKFAPIAAAADGCGLVLRPPATGLLARSPLPPALAAFTIAMLATVLFDGLLGTEAWRIFDLWISARLPRLIDNDDIVLGTLGLLSTWALLLAAYLLACFVAARLVRAASAADLARRLAPSLVPIAIGYHVAHNFSYFLEQSRWVIPLASDPLGRGWNLFGTADYQVVLGFVGARVSWYVAISAIVVGHVLSVWIAHRIALRDLADRRRAVLAGVPLTVLMVGYTALSLSIIADPLVEFRAADAALSRTPLVRADCLVRVPCPTIRADQGTGAPRPPI